MSISIACLYEEWSEILHTKIKYTFSLVLYSNTFRINLNWIFIIFSFYKHLQICWFDTGVKDEVKDKSNIFLKIVPCLIHCMSWWAQMKNAGRAEFCTKHLYKQQLNTLPHSIVLPSSTASCTLSSRYLQTRKKKDRMRDEN